jgi:hypothetical protein
MAGKDQRLAIPAARGSFLRRGGVGDRLPGGATRLTARAGVNPVAVPEGVIFPDVSPLEDLTIRLRYGIGVHEKPVHLIYFGPVIARRRWPDYRVAILGIDLRTLPPDVEGPVFPLPGWEIQTYGRRLLMLHAQVFWRDSPVFADWRWDRRWGPGVAPKESIRDVEHKRNREDVRRAERALELLRGQAPRGPSEIDREDILNAWAAAGRRWLKVRRERGYATITEDVTWEQVADALPGNRKKITDRASDRGVSIKDVHQRIDDLDRWEVH